MACLRRWIRDLHGATSVEFAAIATAFILMVLGSIDIGTAMWTKVTLQSVAEETARCAAIYASSASGKSGCSGAAATAVQKAGERGITITTANVTPTAASTCGASAGTYYQVVITYTRSPILPFVNLTSQTITARSCFPYS